MGDTTEDPAAPVALVTGGATGLGRHVAHGLSRAGYRVAISYRSSTEAAEATVAALRDAGTDADAFRADLADGSAADPLVAAVVGRFGRLDVLVNNAGETAQVPFPDLASLDAATWDRVLGTDLRAPFLLVRAAAPALREARGVVVNVASTSGLAPRGSSIAYSVAKAGLIHLTRCLAVALAPDVRVVAIAPGNMPTGWAQRARAGLGAPAVPPPADPNGVVPAVADLVLTAIRNPVLTGSVVVADRGLIQGIPEPDDG